MTSGAQPGAEGRTDLIAQASAPDAVLPPTGRGNLRIYLGIAPGVGKTYAMCGTHAARRSGTDTVVAYWSVTGGRRPLLSSTISRCFRPVWSPIRARAFQSWTVTGGCRPPPGAGGGGRAGPCEPPR